MMSKNSLQAKKIMERPLRAQLSNYFYVFEGYQKHSSFNTSDLEPEDLFLGVGCQWHDQDQNV